MSVGEFLERVVTTDEGWFLLAVQHQKKWLELWFRWPADLEVITKTIYERREQFDLHFTSHLFSEKHSDKKYVLPTRTIQADLDDADINNLPVQPTVLVTTSPNRYQGYWVLSQCLPQSELEALSRKLTYNIPRCDHAGWPLAHRQRLPDSLSHKYEETHEVKIVSFVDADEGNSNVNPYSIQALNDVEYTEREADDEAWVNTSLRTYPVGPYELLQSIKDKLPQAVYNQYDVPQPDRSAALWALECAAFRAGLDRDAVFHLAKHSANNKFDALQFSSDRELSKDVMRAFKEVKSGARDARGIINEARRLPGTLSERRQYIQRLVHGFMQETGEFVHTIDDQVWYIDHETGKPMYLSENSQQLRYLLDVRFGLNNTETDQRFVASGITAQVASIPARAIATSLSHYDRDAAALYIHTGKRDVIKVTKSEVTKIANGTAGIVFQWLNSTDAFTLDSTPLGSQWCEIVFGKSVDHVVGLPREQALAILRVWLLFLLFKNASVSRPILAIFGQPGAGKSTIFRKLYALLYGARRSVSTVTTPDSFDMTTVTDPFVALDNVDSWEKWLPDRLAQAASSSEIGRRKLWTDGDMVYLRRNAMIAVSAHAPKFGREDVLDRLLLLTLERLETFSDENEIVQEVLNKRNQIWYAIVNDVQRVLNTPYPEMSEAPQFRIADFARMGYWIALGVGIGAEFKAAINTITKSQKVFSLDEDSLLVNTVAEFVKKSKHADDWMGTGELWSRLETYCPDPPLFKKLYQNSQTLGKKLWVLQDALKELFIVEHKIDASKGARVWRINARD